MPPAGTFQPALATEHIRAPLLLRGLDAQLPIYHPKPAIGTQRLQWVKETGESVTSSRPLDSGTVIVADVTQSETPQVSSISAHSTSEDHCHPTSVSSLVRAFAGYTPLINTSEDTLLLPFSPITNTGITEGRVLGRTAIKDEHQSILNTLCLPNQRATMALELPLFKFVRLHEDGISIIVVFESNT